MEVTLPSGATVTLRDKVTAKDKFAVQRAITLSLDTTTMLQESSGGVVNDMRNALLTNLITAWTVPGPIPSQVPLGLDGQPVADPLGDMDLDDYQALADAVEPIMVKVVGNPNPRGRTNNGPSSSS